MKTHEFIEKYYPEYHTIESYPADEVAPITKAAEEWGILGNMTKCSLVVDGVTFPSSEHIYQIMRFSDTEFRKVLLFEKSAFSMKKFKVKTRISETRDEWNSHIVDVMRYVLNLKYEQSEEFRKELARTSDLFILEDETSRQRGKAADSFGAVLSEDGKEYVGPNLLGRLLMELREKGKLEYTLPSELTDFSDLA